MKHSILTRNCKRLASAGLSFAMAANLLFAMPASAATGDAAAPTATAEKTNLVPVKDKTPVPDKAGSISMSQLENNETENDPFPKGTAGNDVFRIPAMITMENGELLAIADARYTQPTDGNGLDTIAAVSSDNGKTWEYGFPFYFPDSYRDIHRQSTAFIDPGLLEGPDGTLYCFADAFPTEYSLQNIGTRLGTGYVEIDGTERLVLTDDYADVATAPVDSDDERYLYYVGDFLDGYAPILKRADHLPTGYAVDEWYNLYSIDKDGNYQDDLRQPQLNNESHQVQQNVYYKDSLFHVFQTGYLWMITSKDHGRTWEHPKDIIPQIKQDDDRSLFISPGCGITTSDGTLVIGLYYHGKGANGGEEKASLMYSTDNGETWQRTADVDTGSSENEIVELEDGTLRMFYRGGSGKISYADFTKNAAGGYDVGAPVSIGECPVTSTCNVTAITYSKKINGKQAVLVACPAGGSPNNAGRNHGKIFTLLVNENKSMSLLHALDVPGSEENFVYSSLTELADGSIGLLWEEGDRTAQIWYDRFDIGDLVPGALLERENGDIACTISLEKGESASVTYSIEGTAQGGLVETAPNENVASAKTETTTRTSIQVPAYAMQQSPDSGATPENTYATGTVSPSLVELTDMEFQFIPNNGSFQIKNEKTGYYMNVVNGDSYFAKTEADISLTAQDDGTVFLHHPHAIENTKTSYAILYTSGLRFNMSSVVNGSSPSGSNFPNFTLWERSADAPEDSEIPGYRKAAAPSADSEDVKSYLITAVFDGNIFLLCPENGITSQTKLFASSPEKPSENAVLAYGVASASGSSQITTAAAYGLPDALPQWTEPADMEFRFTKENDNFHICNEKTSQYMTIDGADSYFSNTAAEITVEPKADGTVGLKTSSTNAVLYKPCKRFNREGNVTSNSQTNFTLWEKSADAPQDSPIPGYQKVSVSNANDLDGKNYLISADFNGLYFLLYPKNGATEQTKLLMPQYVISAYEHVSNNSDLATAFNTSGSNSLTAPVELMKSEFQFMQNEGNYHIYNKESGQYLTLATSATDYFSSEDAGGVAVTLQDGKVQLRCSYTDSGNNPATGYVVFYTTNAMNWNRTTGNSDSAGIYNLTLWERSENAPQDSPIPGYQKLSVSSTDDLNGKSCLITAELDDEDGHVVLLYPKNGVHNQPKLIKSDSLLLTAVTLPEAPKIPEPVISEVTDVTVSVTGKNEGFSTAVIDGRQYLINVTDRIKTRAVGEPFLLPYLISVDTSALDSDVATAETVTGDIPVLYDRTPSAIENSAASFNNVPNEELSIAGAEFTFTEATGDQAGKWIIQSDGKYLVQTNSNGKIFDAQPAPMAVTQTENQDTFQIQNPVGSSNGGSRYLMFHTPGMNFNAANSYSSGDRQFELTLWKKDAAATSSPLPGYRKVAAEESIANNGVYLISYIFEENSQEQIVLLWPKGSENLSESNTATKLARLETALRVTPKAPGMASLVVDGATHLYRIVASADGCAHEKTILKGFRSADCEKEGYSGDTVCDQCDTVIQNGAAVDATGHDWGAADVKSNLTELANGVSYQYCGRSNLHRKKTVVYASAYTKIKELFAAAPDEISEANKSRYKAEDVTELKAAYDEGAAVSQKTAEEQTNKEMYGCISRLSEAKKQLLGHRDGLERSLSWTIAEAGPVHSGGKQESWPQAAWDAFESAYAAATEITNAQGMTYDDLSAVVTGLKDAVAALYRADAKAALQALYDEQKDTEKGDYSDSTWPAFTAARDAAKALLEAEAPSILALEAAAKALEEAAAGLRTNEQEAIVVPGSITYIAPEAGTYPKAAAVFAASDDAKHAPKVSDWTSETPALILNHDAPETEIVNKEGVRGFNGQLSSSDRKFNVNGENRSMAISFKLWLNAIPGSQKEVLAKGQQYSLQIKNGALTLWMISGAAGNYPTVSYPLNAADHVGKWLNVLLLIKGNDYQRIYVNGDVSEDAANKPVLDPSSNPFSLCYSATENINQSFTKADGYLADLAFYDLGTEDISGGQDGDYGQIESRLDAKTPDAVISANTFEQTTVWHKMEAGRANSAMDGTEAFTANDTYMATTAFTANGYFLFPNTEDFRAAVAEKVSTGAKDVQPSVSISDDRRTMTVEAAYVKEGSYAVTFNANAGGDQVTGMPAATTVSQGETLEKPSKTPVRIGYKFLGWSRTKNGDVIANEDWPLAIDENTELFAIWEENVPDPSCSCEIESISVEEGRILIGANEESGTFQLAPQAVIKNGCPSEGHPEDNRASYSYALKDGAQNTAGASVDSDGLVTATKEGTAVITVTAELASGTDGKRSKSADVVIHATKAKEGTYVVTFETNAGSDRVTGMPDPTTVNQGETLDKPSEIPVRDGYQFLGWSRTKNGEPVADADWPIAIEKDTELFAIWEADDEDAPVTKEEAEEAANTALAEATGLLAAGQGNYTKESWDQFQTACQALKDAREDAGTTPEQLKKLADDLDAARKALALDEKKVLDGANAAVSQNAAAIRGGNTVYTAATWKAYADAYAALKSEAAKGGNADAKKLDVLKKNFDAAKKALKADTAWQSAKAALTKALSQAQAAYANGKGNVSKKYTDASWKAFANAYAAAYAKRGAIAGNSSASSLNALAKALVNAKGRLVPAPTLKKGDSVTQGGVTYVVLNPDKKTASAQGEASKKKKKFKVSIKDAVEINGVMCAVTEVKANGFAKFEKISQVTVGKNVTKIGKQAFKDCKAITKLTINGNVKTFDAKCFYNCKKLNRVTFKGTKVPTFKSKAFQGTSSKMTVKLAKKMSKSNKKKMKTKLKQAKISKKAKIS